MFLSSMNSKEDSLGIYIHIPFCVRKCLYCDFLSFPQDRIPIEIRSAYGKAICSEIRSAGESLAVKQAAMIGKPGKRKKEKSVSKERENTVRSIFLGGGTPSLLAPEEIRVILQAVREVFEVSVDAEITMELNPGTIKDAAHARALLAAGINRFSIGVQSLIEEELRALGRIHSAKEAIEVFHMLREAGAENISLDLMYGIPGQTVESWRTTLREALALSPEHLSCYSLIVEEGTPFYARYGENGEDRSTEEWPEHSEKGMKPALPSEEEERAMDHLAREMLAEAGYFHYEISNYAGPGRESRHNLRYWERGAYLGFGIGAASFFDSARWSNTEILEDYLNTWLPEERTIQEMKDINADKVRRIPPEDAEFIDRRAAMEETMFLGLRMMRGVLENAFLTEFGVTIDEVYGREIRKYLREGLLARENGHICLTERGIDLANVVMADFLL